MSDNKKEAMEKFGQAMKLLSEIFILCDDSQFKASDEDDGFKKIEFWMPVK